GKSAVLAALEAQRGQLRSVRRGVHRYSGRILRKAPCPCRLRSHLNPPPPSSDATVHERPTPQSSRAGNEPVSQAARAQPGRMVSMGRARARASRSEEHTSELQSRENLVCRLLLEQKKAIRP